MRFNTHIAFGVLCGLAALKWLGSGRPILYLTTVVIASTLPDIDEPNSWISNKINVLPAVINKIFGHRGFFHSPLFAAVIAFLLYSINHVVAYAFFVGYMSHIIADAMTVQGVNFLYPLKSGHVRGFVQTGSIVETILFIVIIALIALIVLKL